MRLHGLYSPWNSPGQNTGVGSFSLLQGIFPTQGLNPGLQHCRGNLYQLNPRDGVGGLGRAALSVGRGPQLCGASPSYHASTPALLDPFHSLPSSFSLLRIPNLFSASAFLYWPLRLLWAVGTRAFCLIMCVNSFESTPVWAVCSGNAASIPMWQGNPSPPCTVNTVPGNEKQSLQKFRYFHTVGYLALGAKMFSISSR